MSVKKIWNVLKISYKGVRKVAKAQAITSLSDAVKAGLVEELTAQQMIADGDTAIDIKEFIHRIRHHLVRDYLYPIAEKHGYTVEELDIVIPALKVFYKWFKRVYYSQKKFSGGK